MNEETFEYIHAGELKSCWEELGFDDFECDYYNPIMHLRIGSTDLLLSRDSDLEIREGTNRITLKDVNFCLVADLVELFEKNS